MCILCFERLLFLRPVVLKGFCSGVGDSLLALPSVHSPDIVDEESMEEEEEGPREVSALKVSASFADNVTGYVTNWRAFLSY